MWDQYPEPAGESPGVGAKVCSRPRSLDKGKTTRSPLLLLRRGLFLCAGKLLTPHPAPWIQASTFTGSRGSSTRVQFKERLAAVLRSAPRVCFSEGLYTSSRQGSHASLRCASSVGVHMVKKSPSRWGWALRSKFYSTMWWWRRRGKRQASFNEF